MARLLGIATLASVLLAGGQAAAAVIWRGDYESGDLRQWSKVQAVSPDRLQVEQSRTTQGKYALKATVRQGDNPIGASGNRNELAYMSLEQQGAERYYRWQTMFAEDYPSAKTWQLFTQWHHSGPNGSPPVQFVVNGEDLYLAVNQERVWGMPLKRGQWIDFVFHVRWSPSPAEGFVELWVDGQHVLPKRGAKTQFPGELNYLKQGLYRDSKVAAPGVVYHDGMTIGTELADVMPVAAKVAASPTPDAAPSADKAGTQPQQLPDLTAKDLEAAGCGGATTARGAPMLGAALAALAVVRRRVRRATATPHP